MYTLKLKDSEKADKLKQSLPPSMCNPKRSSWKFKVGRRERSVTVVEIALELRLMGLFAPDLTMTDVPKKNKKGKRVA